ncbi:MAG: histidine kinase [Brevibacterium sp.]|nr:histidine kinase [Brevibacterium sp.]MDN6666254.1 histidine kinase [Brevibacterium sp.]
MSQRRIPVISWFFPCLWLVFLAYPLAGSWQQTGPNRVWGLGLTIVFAVLFYIAMLVGGIGVAAVSRNVRPVVAGRRPALNPIILACLVGMVLIAVIGIPVIGEGSLSFLAYISVIVVIILRRVVPGLIVAFSTLAIAEVAQRIMPGWTHDYSTTFGISIAGFGMVMALMAGDRARAARAAEDENRRLERETERLRLSQDVHDVLGHSLTVIALKAQLAAKLEAQGAPETAKQIAEIEQLARGALADVRSTVQGTRRISLAEELVAATRALRAAGILVEAPVSVDDVAADLRELFAWAVREGSTNILRHSHARHATITLGSERLTVRNDASGHRTGLAEVGAGTGLRGLGERAESVGAAVRTQNTDDGFVLIVERQDADARAAGTASANCEGDAR